MLRSWSPTKLANVVLLAVVILAPARAVAVVNLDRSLPFGMVVWVGLAAIGLGLAITLADFLPRPLNLVAIFIGAATVAGIVALTTPSSPLDPGLKHHVIELVQEFMIWFHAVSSGSQATDNRLFLLLISEVAWVLGYSSTWLLVKRHSVWLPVTSGVVSVLLVLMAFPTLAIYAWVQLVAALALVARVNLQQQREDWVDAGVQEPVDLSRRAIIVGIPVSVGLVGLGWLAPTTLTAKVSASAPTPVRESWLKAQGEFYRMFGGLRASSLASLSGFSTSLVLHGSFHLASTPVLEIAASLPEYWRAIVYDQYTGNGWLSSNPIQNRTLPAGATIQQNPPLKSRALLPQKVTVLESRGNYLVGAAQPVQFNRPAILQLFSSSPASANNVVAAIAQQILVPGSQYTVMSNVSTATAEQLREAGRDYPTDIRERYLALPRIPRQVRHLAWRLTARESTPYDKATAVESYLKTLTYSLDVPVPPANRDNVDYFLFVTRTGYCDYFASAMAVLLRSVGIPSRVVSGYATGQKQSNGTYLVQDANAHSWTEVYFPEYGWIPFDPSAGWPSFPRGVTVPQSASQATPIQNQATTKQSTPVPTPIPTPPSGDTLPESSSSTALSIDLRPALPFLGGLGLAGLGGLFARHLWEKDLRRLPAPVVAYVKMTRLATVLGVGPKDVHTPREYARTLSHALPEASDAINEIADLYGEQVFGRTTTTNRSDAVVLWLRFRSAFVKRVAKLGRGNEHDINVS